MNNHLHFSIFYDGGAQNGRGYGSYVVIGPEGLVSYSAKRLHFMGQANGFLAEYETLHRALMSLGKCLSKKKIDPQATFLHIYGDNRMVQGQLTGNSPCLRPSSVILNGKVGARLKRFAGYEAHYFTRVGIKTILGH
mgnify:FL=1